MQDITDAPIPHTILDLTKFLLEILCIFLSSHIYLLVIQLYELDDNMPDAAQVRNKQFECPVFCYVLLLRPWP